MAKTPYTTTSKGAQSDDDLSKEITEQFLLAKRYLDQVHQRMNFQEELYRTYIDKNTYPHNARVFDPRVFRVIETIVPRMVANEPSGSFYPSEQGDIATSQMLNALIKYDWRRAEMFPKLVMFCKSMLIFGTAFGRVHWDYRTKMRTRMKPKQLNGRMVWTPTNSEQIEVTEFDGPNFEVLNIYDCFPDPNATDLSNMRWFIYRMFRTMDELEAATDVRGEPVYKNLDKLRERVEKKDKGDGTRNTSAYPNYMQYREHRRTMLSTSELHGQDDSNPEVVVLRRFTRDGWCDVAVEYGIVIREQENPYFDGDLPIIYGTDYPYPGELYGMGEIEPIDRIQRAINAVLNQRLDNVQLTLRNMWKVKKSGGVDMHTLFSAPGNIITTEDMNAVEPIEIPDVTGPTFVQTMTYLTSAMQNGSGITDYTVGVGNNQTVANDTATGTRLIQQEANAQFKLKIQLFNHMVIQRVANLWKNLRIQYTTEEQKLRIIGTQEVQSMMDTTSLSQVDLQGNPIAPGEQVQAKLQPSADNSFAFLTILPEDIQPAIVGDYDFIAVVSEDQLSDPIAMQQNFFSALDRVSNPNWQQGLMNQGKTLDFATLTEKVFDQMKVGLEGKDAITDMPQQQAPPMPGQPQPGQPLDHQSIQDFVGQPVQNPISNPLMEQAVNQAMGGAAPNGQPTQ